MLHNKLLLVLARGYRRDANIREIMASFNERSHYLLDPIIQESTQAALILAQNYLILLPYLLISIPFFSLLDHSIKIKQHLLFLKIEKQFMALSIYRRCRYVIIRWRVYNIMSNTNFNNRATIAFKLWVR